MGEYLHGFHGCFDKNKDMTIYFDKNKGHDYLFVVVDRFSKMCNIMPSKKIIHEQYATNMFFEKV